MPFLPHGRRLYLLPAPPCGRTCLRAVHALTPDRLSGRGVSHGESEPLQQNERLL